MGSSHCREVADAIQALPAPWSEEMLWMVSCRPRNDCSKLSGHTLLFQPDCRKFCLKGSSCTFQHDPALEVVHSIPAVVRAAAEQDVRGRSTRVVNMPQVAVQVPYVQQCWCVDSADAALVESLPNVFSERPVVIWVQGLQHDFLRTVEVARHLMHRLRERAGGLPQSAEPLVVPFLWPAHSQGSAYTIARSNAWKAAPRLRALLEVLQRRLCRTVVIGHSLGCRLALHALHLGKQQQQQPLGEARRRSSLCAHLVLVSAAVPSDALAPHGRFPRGEIDAEHVTVIASERDSVLRKYYSIGETTSGLLFQAALRHPTALGLVGPTGSDLPDVRSVHLGISHNEHSALCSEAVQLCIAEAVWGGQVAPLPASGASSADHWSLLAADDDNEGAAGSAPDGIEEHLVRGSLFLNGAGDPQDWVLVEPAAA